MVSLNPGRLNPFLLLLLVAVNSALVLQKDSKSGLLKMVIAR